MGSRKGQIQMSTPHGMKCTPKTLVSGEKVLLSSDTQQSIFQLRHQVPSGVPTFFPPIFERGIMRSVLSGWPRSLVPAPSDRRSGESS